MKRVALALLSMTIAIAAIGSANHDQVRIVNHTGMEADITVKYSRRHPADGYSVTRTIGNGQSLTWPLDGRNGTKIFLIEGLAVSERGIVCKTSIHTKEDPGEWTFVHVWANRCDFEKK